MVPGRPNGETSGKRSRKMCPGRPGQGQVQATWDPARVFEVSYFESALSSNNLSNCIPDLWAVTAVIEMSEKAATT